MSGGPITNSKNISISLGIAKYYSKNGYKKKKKRKKYGKLYIYIRDHQNDQSDDRVSVKLRVTESYVLPICPSFTHATLCESIEHYKARIDYNQYNQYIYIYDLSEPLPHYGLFCSQL